MAQEVYSQRALFGGAISSIIPNRFQDVSNVRQVPDHQEAFVDPARDESLIIELLDLKPEVGDNGSAAWFLQDLATEQEAEGSVAISKGRQGREAQNTVRVYVANLRLKGVNTDVLITAYEPIHINPLSESANTVGAGLAAPALQSGHVPMAEVFRLAVSSFKINDWNLFGSGP
ncbi:uncharacterized protein LOC133709935 isoform X2 [Rosa rugosa]|uniref:uncharacterized protein LOC133709935 isoform X2 n=1 Tax=Rosa rugosa TaxID=74645 RepID=UPI002B4180DD|nr:uncharacterized protein LOC133709935 isoform X2 [Rosa rugosa]